MFYESKTNNNNKNKNKRKKWDYGTRLGEIDVVACNMTSYCTCSDLLAMISSNQMRGYTIILE